MKKKTLSQRQLQVMELLWDSEDGMTASAIVKANQELQINTVQASLRSLVAKNYIKVGDIVYSGTVLSRKYVPVISREEYLEISCEELTRISPSHLVAANLIRSEEDPQILEELEKMIKRRKKEIEGKE